MKKKRGRKKKVPDHTILPECLVQLLGDYPNIKFIDSHIHIEMMFQRMVPGNLQKSKQKYEEVKNIIFTKNKRIRQKIFNALDFIVQIYCEHVSFSALGLYKELVPLSEEEVPSYACFGVHPHDAKNYNHTVEKNMLKCLDYERCVALGEIGLDYHYMNSPKETQQKVFKLQLRLAVNVVHKPIVIHSREAEEDTIEIMKELIPKDHHIHLHCYTSLHPTFAYELMNHFENLYIGFTGILTYNSFCKNEIIDELIQKIPLNRVLLESDAPYLPARSNKYLKRKGEYDSSCLNIPFVGLKFYELRKDKSVSFEEFMKQVNENTRTMYKIKEE